MNELQVFSVTLDVERAAQLSRLAARLESTREAAARSLLSRALDVAEPEAFNLLQVLDDIPGAHERAMFGRRQAAEGNTVALDDI